MKAMLKQKKQTKANLQLFFNAFAFATTKAGNQQSTPAFV